MRESLLFTIYLIFVSDLLILRALMYRNKKQKKNLLKILIIAILRD